MSNMSQYRKYLAEQILTRDQVVTYRYLSRTLGVHVNVAKRMLYEFHNSQNERKPGTVYATYLIYGVRSRDEPQNHEGGARDVEMTSSIPEAESLSDRVPVHTLSLVEEGGLTDCLEQYAEVDSIHVYSIGPHPMNDLQLLSDAARQAIELCPTEDVGESSKKLGTIVNPAVRCRETQGAVPRPVAVAPEPAKAKTQPERRIDPSVPSSEEPKPQHAAAAGSISSSSTQSTDKKPAPPSLKRGGSGIMQAFAKAAAAKPKKKEAVATGRSSATPSGAEEGMSDDGEDDSAPVPAPDGAPRQLSVDQAGAGRKTRKEREEELRRMMEDNDDETGKEEDEGDAEEADTPMEEVGEEIAPPEPAAAPEPEEAAEIVSGSTGDGRRRGKRRVMRKNQMMDAQGYLVTVQEAGWESFSEDDIPSASSKSSKPAISVASSQTTSKSKKAAKGQGNIMSFFSKK